MKNATKDITSLTGPHHQVSQELNGPNLSIEVIWLILKNLQNLLQLDHIRKAKS